MLIDIMLFKSNMLLIILAGLMNGSFVIPARYIKNIVNEEIWFYHSIIGLAIIPWIILAITLPSALHHYLFLQPTILIFIIFSGLIFGLGQICFSYAIESIGVALSFTINLGIGVTIGSLFVVFYKTTFFTLQAYLVILAVFLILLSLIIYYYAGKNSQERQYLKYQKSSHYRTGWLLASLAGVASGLQNITFVTVAFYTKTQFQISNSFWVWPPFLFAAAIAMFFGFLYRIKRNPANKLQFLGIKSTLLIAIMGLFFTGSLALYSGGMNKLTHQQQIIGWPAFMITIILTSQIWGWLYSKVSGVALRNKLFMICSVMLLVIAIIILSFES